MVVDPDILWLIIADLEGVFEACRVGVIDTDPVSVIDTLGDALIDPDPLEVLDGFGEAVIEIEPVVVFDGLDDTVTLGLVVVELDILTIDGDAEGEPVCIDEVDWRALIEPDADDDIVATEAV